MKRVEDGSSVTTLEGIGTPEHLHPLQQAWIYHGGAQCGFCTPGFIVSAKALLDVNPNPSREEVRDWFQDHRNACRCTGYKPLVDAVMDAAAVMRGDKSVDDIIYKEPADGSVWGTRRPRPSTVARVTGTALYGDDMADKLPEGTLHLALTHAKVSHANIKGIDTSEAEAMPGVYRVLTYKDVKGNNRISGLSPSRPTRATAMIGPSCATKRSSSTATPWPSCAPTPNVTPARPPKRSRSTWRNCPLT